MALDDLLALGRAAQEGEGAVCDFTDDYLHVTLTDELPRMDAMAKVRELFGNAMSLDYDNASILRARAQVRHAVDPEKLDICELFAAFYKEQTGNDLDAEQAELVATAVHLIEEEEGR